MTRARRDWVAGLVLVLVLVAACGGTHHGGPADPRVAAVVLVQSNVKDAQLFVDGRFVSTLDTARGGVAVSPGTHRFELRREEYFSAYLELVDLKRSERKKVSMPMAAVLP